MKYVNLNFETHPQMHRYAQELSIWTAKTSYMYYPLSYSLRDCLELICERLGWEFLQYVIFDSINGCLYARKPEPEKIITMDWWNITTATDWSSNTYHMVGAE